MLHTKAVLLVDHGEREPREAHPFLNERMRPNHEIDTARRRSLQDNLFLRGGLPAGDERAVHGKTFQKSPEAVSACCSARISVGAMRTAWPPFSTAKSIAESATIVLPLPTSPCSSRFIGSGFIKSSKISRMTRFCGAVNSNPRCSRKGVSRVPAQRVAMVFVFRFTSCRTRASAVSRAKNSSKARNSRARSFSSSVSGKWMVESAQASGLNPAFFF